MDQRGIPPAILDRYCGIWSRISLCRSFADIGLEP